MELHEVELLNDVVIVIAIVFLVIAVYIVAIYMRYKLGLGDEAMEAGQGDTTAPLASSRRRSINVSAEAAYAFAMLDSAVQAGDPKKITQWRTKLIDHLLQLSSSAGSTVEELHIENFAKAAVAYADGTGPRPDFPG